MIAIAKERSSERSHFEPWRKARRKIEIPEMERDNAGQAGMTEQTESSDWISWYFQGKSGKQTDSHSIALILPSCLFCALLSVPLFPFAFKSNCRCAGGGPSSRSRD